MAGALCPGPFSRLLALLHIHFSELRGGLSGQRRAVSCWGEGFLGEVAPARRGSSFSGAEWLVQGWPPEP